MIPYDDIDFGLTFDDILLIPQYSEIESRSEVKLDTSLHNLKLKIPIISANMDTVTGLEMAKTMSQNGALGVLHRYTDPQTTKLNISALKGSGCYAIPSIGLRNEDYDLALSYIEAGADAICIDVAHGYCSRMLEMLKKLKGKTTIIAGNVATLDAAWRLAYSGANVIKVGIGPGSLCTTRIVTGHGVPQISALLDVTRLKMDFPELGIISDGGIRNSGDIVKALAAGADAVMVGSLFAGKEESEGETIGTGLMRCKVYRGMASKSAQIDFKGSVGNDVPEGEETLIPVSGSAVTTLNELAAGIRSGLSYSGCSNIKDFQNEALYCKISNASLIESTPHGKK